MDMEKSPLIFKPKTYLSIVLYLSSISVAPFTCASTPNDALTPKTRGNIPQAIIVRTTENMSHDQWHWIVDKAVETGISRIDILVKQDENNYYSEKTGRTLSSGELLVKLPGERTAAGWQNSKWLHDLIAYSKNKGIEIWAWWPVFQDAVLARKFPHHSYRHKDGSVFVDASVQGVQLRQEDLLRKLTDTFSFDGVSLDWLRYNKISDGRRGPIAQHFLAISGKPWSAQLVNQPLMNALWYDLRSTTISEWVTRLVSYSRNRHPDLKWGAFVLPWQFKEVAQSYRGMAKSGLDYLQPLIYWNDWNQNARWTRQVVNPQSYWFRDSSSSLWPVFDVVNSQAELKTALTELPVDNLSGVSWFEYGVWTEAKFRKLASIAGQWQSSGAPAAVVKAAMENKPANSNSAWNIISKLFSPDSAIWMLVCLDELYNRGALKSNTIVPVLAFHRFAYGELASSQSQWVNSTAFVDSLLAFIFNQGFNVIPLSQLQAFMIAEDPKLLPARPLVLTVDDGSRSVLEHFHKRAKSYGFPYAVSLVTDWIEVHTSKEIGEYGDSDLILNLKEIKNLNKSGLVEFLSHSHASHAYTPITQDRNDNAPVLLTRSWLLDLDRPETRYERKQRSIDDLKKARSELKQINNKSTTILAWPYGEFDQASIAAARAAGYTHFLRFGPSRFATPRWNTSNIDRVAVTRADETISLAMPKNARTEQLWWLAFLGVARKTASVELMEATLDQLNALSSTHPQAELSRAAIDMLRGFSARGHRRVNILLTAYSKDPEIRVAVKNFLNFYDPGY